MGYKRIIQATFRQESWRRIPSENTRLTLRQEDFVSISATLRQGEDIYVGSSKPKLGKVLLLRVFLWTEGTRQTLRLSLFLLEGWVGRSNCMRLWRERGRKLRSTPRLEVGSTLHTGMRFMG